MSGEIFISYRREDSQAYAGRLFDRLEQAFGRDRIFLDVDSIEPGLDFMEVLRDRLQTCKVVLAVIGPGWVGNIDSTGASRLEDPDDFVRLELETALSRGIRVIPVLVAGANLPARMHLPASLGTLVTRQAVKISHERFAPEATSLVTIVGKVLGSDSSSTSEVERVQSELVRPISRGWTARWVEEPGFAYWALELVRLDKTHLLEAKTTGIFLDGRKVMEQPLGFTCNIDFAIGTESFGIFAHVGLFSVKVIRVTVESELLIEWKK